MIKSSLLLNITLLVGRLFCNLLFEEMYLIKRGKIVAVQQNSRDNFIAFQQTSGYCV